MPQARIWSGSSRKAKTRKYEFEIVLLPIYETDEPSEHLTKKRNGRRARIGNSAKPRGYQVTVPSLPGLITFGRTLEEAREMAGDAVLVHLEGLRKAGELIPDEGTARKETLRVALNAQISPRLPVLKPREVLSALLRAGFIIHHQAGSHAQLRHPAKTHLRVTVPRHDRFDLPLPVLKSILRQAEMTVEEFLDCL